MLIFYMDDTGENGYVGFAALGLPSDSWKVAYESLSAHRRELAKKFKIPLSAEFHATDFIGGRGSAGQAVRDKNVRLEIFNQSLALANAIEGATLLSAFDQSKYEDRLYERLVNRINTCASELKTQAIIISDEGKNAKFRALSRKLGSHNPIPSRYGAWGPGGVATRNIPNNAILEDVIFRQSSECRFIQLADFCAYALLRLERPHATRPELSLCFDQITKICNKRAFARDHRGLGIVRGQ